MSQTSIFAGSLFSPIIRSGNFLTALCFGLSDGEEDEDDEEEDVMLLLFVLGDANTEPFLFVVFSLT